MNRLNSTVLMSDSRHFATTHPINPYYSGEAPDITLAQKEHASIKHLLESVGVAVIQVPSPAGSQDGVYTANWALVREDTAVLARLPHARKAEEAYAEKVLRELGKKIVKIPGRLRFSGQGDALPFGNYLFCGQRYRADIEAQEFAANMLGYNRIQLETIPELDARNHPVINKASGWPDSFFYDIDLALSVLRAPENGQKGLIAYCPEAFTPESQSILESFNLADKIYISLEEATIGFGANLISTGDTVIMSGKAPKFAAAIKAKNFKVLTPNVTELAKGGGYIRCTTLSFN